MAKYSQFDHKKPAPKGHKIHPVWSGIGFLMIILVPIIVWASASELAKFGRAQHWSLLNSFPQYLNMGFLGAIPGLSLLGTINELPATVAFFVFLLVVVSGLFSMTYAFVYRLVGPPRYAPDDIPAPKVKTKPFKR